MSKVHHLLVLALLFFAASFASLANGQVTELHLICSNVIKTAVEQLTPAFERETGQRVVVKYGASGQLKLGIEKGEAFDAALLTTGVVDDLIRQGFIATGSRTGIAQANLAVAVKSGSIPWDVSTAAGMRERLLAAKSIAYSKDGGGVAAIERMLKTLGIVDQIKARTFPLAEAGSAAARVATGEYEISFAPLTEIVAVPGAQVLGLFPAEFQSPLAISSGIGAKTKNAAAASFVTFLLKPDSMKVIAATGMTPIPK